MPNLIYTIKTTKRKLKEASDKLDEIFQEQQEILDARKKELEARYNKLEESFRNFDKDKVILKITSRMVYLNRLPRTQINDIRIDELSKILDWLEELDEPN